MQCQSAVASQSARLVLFLLLRPGEGGDVLSAGIPSKPWVRKRSQGEAIQRLLRRVDDGGMAIHRKGYHLAGISNDEREDVVSEHGQTGEYAFGEDTLADADGTAVTWNSMQQPLPEECSKAQLLPDQKNHLSTQKYMGLCDSNLSGWYTFPDFELLGVEPTSRSLCGADAPGFLTELPPKKRGETVHGAKVCFKMEARCQWHAFVDITHCGDDFVYRLHATPTCNLAYCFTMRPPVPCKWGPWTGFGECSATCGGGHKYRTREALSHAKRGGMICRDRDGEESEPCNFKAPCPFDCSWKFWSEWRLCGDQDKGAKCGFGRRVRRRDSDPARHGGKPCAGLAEEIEIAEEERQRAQEIAENLRNKHKKKKNKKKKMKVAAKPAETMNETVNDTANATNTTNETKSGSGRRCRCPLIAMALTMAASTTRGFGV